MLAEQLTKGELHLGTEVRLLDPNVSEDDREWTTVEQGPAAKEFYVQRIYNPVGAFVQHGGKLGMVYFSIFMWIVAPLMLFTLSSIIEHGAKGLLYGPLIAVLFVGVTLGTVFVSVWLVMNDNQAIVVIGFLLFGCAPFFIILEFAIIQLLFMGIGFALGSAAGAIVGVIRKDEFRRPST